jgi:outer membrane protein W
MRLALAVLALAAASPALATSESYQPWRVDTTINFYMGSADIAEYGMGAAVEPKYNLTDRLSLGLRLEGAALVPESVSVGEDNVSMGVRAFTAYMAKADFYLTTSSVRPFVGIAAGRYSIGGIDQSAGSAGVVQKAAVFDGWGFAPQVGVNFGGFRLAATYHVITGGDRIVVTQAVGATEPVKHTMPTNYFALELGGTFGGGKLDRAAPATPVAMR